LENLHNIFHVSQLRKYGPNPTHVLEEDEVHIRGNLSLDVGSMQVLDVQVKQLRGKEICTVKVLWNEGTQEETWELENSMKKSYPYMFPGKYNFQGRNFFRPGENEDLGK